MYVLAIPRDSQLGQRVSLTPGRWHELRFDWSNARSSKCRLTVDGKPTPLALPLVRPSINGISYVHFQTLSHEADAKGFLIESVEGRKEK